VTTALADIPALALTEAEAARLSFGQPIPLVELMGRVPREANPDGGLARAMAGGRLMGLARFEEGLLKPERWLDQGGSQAERRPRGARQADTIAEGSNPGQHEG
jgi:tRNA pseudouridine55 synthase